MNNKLISQLMNKLKSSPLNSEEREDIEDQILRLVEQDEIIGEISKPKSENSNIIEETKIEEELDENEKIRLQREQVRKDKEMKYVMDNKLETKEDELMRQDMMNQALEFDNDYAFRKTRKNNKFKRNYFFSK